MVEKVEEKDEFVGYRNMSVWLALKEDIAIGFPDNVIPQDMEPHLMEWLGIRSIEKPPTDLLLRFWDCHDSFFENELFVKGINRIKELTTKYSANKIRLTP